MKKEHYLMILCTLFLAAAQFFQKMAGDRLVLSVEGFLLNWPFYVGIALAGIGAILMTMALRGGELSKIFPLISLSFIWTALISVFFFGEVITLATTIGIAFIILGVAVLGRSGVGT